MKFLMIKIKYSYSMDRSKKQLIFISTDKAFLFLEDKLKWLNHIQWSGELLGRAGFEPA